MLCQRVHLKCTDMDGDNSFVGNIIFFPFIKVKVRKKSILIHSVSVPKVKRYGIDICIFNEFKALNVVWSLSSFFFIVSE